ncbi:MAG: DUF3160 domain-containing protein [Armatimonadetes bacterium]|nr:DUF3160 domain-containing protein [Armatimonadota bacterium]
MGRLSARLLCASLLLLAPLAVGARTPANLDQMSRFLESSDLGDWSQHPDPGAAKGLAEALADHGFAVIGGRAAGSLHGFYHDAYLAGMTVVVTSDAMLDIWYEVHRQILEQIEEQRLLPQTKALLSALWRAHLARPDNAPREEVIALATALRLAGVQVDLPPDLVSATAPALAEMTAPQAPYPGDDYGRGMPRLSADDRPVRQSYLRTVRFLGRHSLALAGPDATAASVRRAAWWVALLRRDDAARSAYRDLAAMRTWLWGDFNGSDTAELDRALLAAGADPEQLDEEACRRVLAEMARPEYTPYALPSRPYDPMTEQLPSRRFAPLPDHAPPDARLLQSLLERQERPSGLAVAAALGLSGAVAKVDPPVARLRPAADNVHDRWLALLSELDEQPAGAPRFMGSTQWRDKTVQTALTSWAQLKYSAEPYSADSGEPYAMPSALPKGLVEPLPRFWRAYGALVSDFAEQLRARGLTAAAGSCLTILAREARWAAEDADRELAGQVPLHSEHWRSFSAVLRTVPCGAPAALAPIAELVDGRIYVGSGLFRPIVEQFELPGLPPFAAVGAVGSYHEFVEPGRRDVTADEWHARLNAAHSRPRPPAWTSTFVLLADSAGPTARTVLATAELDLVAGRAQAAIDRLRAFQPSVAGTEVEVEAQILIGRACERLGDLRAARDAYMACDTMYGCQAADEALDRARQCGGAMGRWRAEQDRQERQLKAKLAATDPKPGLTPEQELDRQDTRARLMVVLEGGYVDLPRLEAECPRSRLLPAMRLAAAAARWVPPWANEPGYRDDDHWTRPLADLTQSQRDNAGSLLAELAAVVAADTLANLDPQAALDRVLPYLGVARQAEPQPQAAAWLAERYQITPGMAPAQRWIDLSASCLLRAAFARGDAALYRRLRARFGPKAQQDPLQRWVVDHEPEVMALWSAAREEQADPEPALRRLLSEHPRSALAPLALARLIGGKMNAMGLMRCSLVGWGLDRALLTQLARDYPDTRDGLRAAALLACIGGDLDRGIGLWRRAAARPEGPWASAAPRSPLAEDTWMQGVEPLRVAVHDAQPFLPGWDSRRICLELVRCVEQADDPNGLDALLAAAGPQAEKLLAALPPWVGQKAARSHREPSDLEVLAKRIDAGPGPGYEEAVAELAQDLDHNDAPWLDALLATPAGRPSYALLRIERARGPLLVGWLEQAIAAVTPLVDEAGPFQPRAQALLAEARERLAVRREPRLREAWRVELDSVFGQDKPALQASGDLVIASYVDLAGVESVVALDRATGRTRWHRPAQQPRLEIAGDVVCLVSRQELALLDRVSGRALHSEPLKLSKEANPDIVIRGDLFLIGLDEYRMLARASGRPGWEITTSHPMERSFVGDRVLVMDYDHDQEKGTLSAYALSTGRRLWRTPLWLVESARHGPELSYHPKGQRIIRYSDSEGNTIWQAIDMATGTLSRPRHENGYLDEAERPNAPAGNAWVISRRDVDHIEPGTGRRVPLLRLPPEYDGEIADEQGVLAWSDDGALVCFRAAGDKEPRP